MKIKGHRLWNDDDTPIRFERTRKMSAGAFDPQYLVIHYTAGSSLDSAVRTLTNPSIQASCHIAIGRDGTIVQMVPFSRIAWHAGRSRWQGLVGMNRYSIGIELDNAGKLTRQGTTWRSWFGRVYPDDDVIVAVHKNETRETGWHAYTEPQMESVTAVGRLLVARYQLKDVVGHDDIAPGRKQDPGPAFPMDNFRSHVMGRQDDAFELFETIANLNIRSGPGTQYDRLTDTALPQGTRLELHERDGGWCAVDVIDEAGMSTLSGWVHGNYIKPA